MSLNGLAAPCRTQATVGTISVTAQAVAAAVATGADALLLQACSYADGRHAPDGAGRGGGWVKGKLAATYAVCCHGC